MYIVCIYIYRGYPEKVAVNLPLSEAKLRSLILGVKTNYLPKTNYLVKTNCEDEFAEDELPAEDEF